jgi:hypothetical protein
MPSGRRSGWGTADRSGTVSIGDHLLDHLRVEVDGDTVRIDLDGQVRDATLRADLGVVRLERVSASGATHIRVEGPRDRTP